MFEIVAFMLGLCIMILEISGARVIAPFLGSDFIVWTTVIGIMMLFLSIGYYFGGRLADKKVKVLYLSLFLLVAGLYQLIISFTQFNFLKYITYTNINIYIKALFSAIYLFGISSLFLGISSPYVIKLAIIKKNISISDSGKIIGKFYFLSTFGSIIGTFLSGFYLIMFFGLEKISFFLSLLILFCSIIAISIYFQKKILYYLIICTQIILIIISLNIFLKKDNQNYIFNNTIYSTTTNYQYLAVIEQAGLTYLYNSVYGSHVTIDKKQEPDDRLNIFPYTKFFMDIYKIKTPKKNILIIGNAGGSFVSAFVFYNKKRNINDTKIDIVEIDKKTTDVSYKYFDMKIDSNVKFYYEDARTFINNIFKNNNKKYDIIYLDANFNGIMSPYLFTNEFNFKIKSILNDNGIYVINAINARKDSTKNEINHYSYLINRYKKYFNQLYTNLLYVFEEIYAYAFPNSAEDKIYNCPIVYYKNAKDSNAISIQNKYRDKIYKNIKLSNFIYNDNFAPIERIYINKY